MKALARVLLLLLVMPLALPSSAGTNRCTPVTKDHSAEAHGSTSGHRRVCGMELFGSVEVSKTGGLGQIDTHGGIAAIVQRDEGVVALVDYSTPSRPRILGRYDDEVSEALDGDVAFSNDGDWVFFARQTSNFDEDGVHVLDVSDRKSPTLTQYQPGGGSLRLEYYRDAEGAEWVVVLDAIEGLVVNRFVRETGTLVKVFTDSQPALKVGGPASAGVFISKKDPMTGTPLLYVTTGETGLQVYDFSNPAAPEIVGEWSDVGLADLDVRVTEDQRIVYAATEYWFTKTTPGEVIVLDATKLDGIEKIGRRRLEVPADDTWRVQGIDFAGSGLYIAHSHAGVVRFKRRASVSGGRPTGVASLPGTHNEQAGYNAAPYAMDVFVDGYYVLVTDASSGILTILGREEEVVLP